MFCVWIVFDEFEWLRYAIYLTLRSFRGSHQNEKRLLLFGDLTHKNIAYDLGFDSPSSFSAFIKKKTGFTPSEIQAQVNKSHS